MKIFRAYHKNLIANVRALRLQHYVHTIPYSYNNVADIRNFQQYCKCRPSISFNQILQEANTKRQTVYKRDMHMCCTVHNISLLDTQRIRSRFAGVECAAVRWAERIRFAPTPVQNALW